ncbi:hypothetical protein N7474_008164 [Penicillium riverlandense]|uniref:uncharacterized protein n=1 Tax=Penicillium riverlandense TaxID=1903569 RepID=UPI002548D510|nr:uncharacterized protein N7474_008164 [Penicillium riverlandense]KAJ5811863.1 hypothetical protein N7474_008164 [Penicillium riverlandense]
MKLIVAGATGLVGAEVIRQSLQISEISLVIALSRKPVQVEDDIYSSKLKSVVISDYEEYPDHVKAEFAGADACIWTVAVTPFRAGSFDFTEVKRCETELMVLDFPAQYEGVEVCIAQPGVVTNSITWSRAALSALCRVINVFGRVVPTVDREELSKASDWDKPSYE